MRINPLTRTDYPDPDIIRVGDCYYMISTTMYFMPGGVILRSYNLRDWEIASYVFDELDGTDSERLVGLENNYGKGMWAACLRYNDGKFYVAFVSHGRTDTHLFISDSIEGPWEHKTLPDYYHDCSILFDDDRVFVVSGNTNIRLTELKSDLSGIRPPNEGGIDKIIIRDDPDEVRLGYEGSHIYKINGQYVITLIHWPKYNGRRTEAVFISNSIDGEYKGKDVLWDDMNYHDMGVAQGGLVESTDNKWYAVLFQDSGAVGRIPVLVPISWESKDGFPIYGANGVIPEVFFTRATKPEYEDYKYESLFTSDDFEYKEGESLKKQWQWNHVPDNSLWSVEEGKLGITTGKVCTNLTQAQNTLTQRMCIPSCSGSVCVDATNLNDGDYIGLCALQSCYGFIGIERSEGKNYLVVLERTHVENPFQIGSYDNEPGAVTYRKEINSNRIYLRISADFGDMRDVCEFSYSYNGDIYEKIGDDHKLHFYLDHFTGSRFGLCVFSTKSVGGTGYFEGFVYEY